VGGVGCVRVAATNKVACVWVGGEGVGSFRLYKQGYVACVQGREVWDGEGGECVACVPRRKGWVGKGVVFLCVRVVSCLFLFLFLFLSLPPFLPSSISIANGVADDITGTECRLRQSVPTRFRSCLRNAGGKRQGIVLPWAWSLITWTR
jgi:hypothetical protein